MAGGSPIKLKDGKVTVFLRPESRTSNYFYRFKYPGTKDKFERRTTGTRVLKSAKKLASERYSEVCFLHSKGYTVHSPTVGDLCRDYLIFWRRLLDEGEITKGTYINKKGPIEEYLIPFFGQISADELSQDDVDAFPKWRVEERVRKSNHAKATTAKKEMYYKAFDEKKQVYVTRTKQVPFNIWAQRIPTKRSMQYEIKILINVLDHGVFSRAIKPSQKPAIWIARRRRVRRGYFNETSDPKDPTNTYYRLQSVLLANYLETKNKDGSKRACHHKFMAEQLYYWALLMSYTGLRTNEMLEVQHKHVQIDEDGDLIIKVITPIGEKGRKNRHRLVVADRIAGTYWQNYLEFRERRFVDRLVGFPEKPSGDEYLWLNWRGGREGKHLQQRFQSLLSKADLTVDEDGHNLSAYSLRHTYCVRKLREGTPIYSLALNMGTSVQSIERYYGLIVDTVAMKNANGLKRSLRGAKVNEFRARKRTISSSPLFR